MNIRQKLALKFCLLVASMFLVFGMSLYYFSSSYRATEFTIRMKNRGTTIVNLLSDESKINTTLLNSINADTKNALFNETVEIFDASNKLLYADSKKDLYNLKKRESYSFNYLLKDKNYKVTISAYDQYGMDYLVNLRIILFIGLILSVFSSYFAGWLFAGLALQPISEIIREANEITVSKLNLRLNEGNQKDELAQLAITFNRVLERLKTGFEMQRAFISNASHELRTPLTSLSGHIEVNLKKERSTGEYIELLESLLIDIKGLSKISNNLLDLALATTDSGRLKLKQIRIDELLYSARSKLLKNYPLYSVNIQFTHSPESENALSIFGNDALIETAFYNLMENACKYSDNHSSNIYFDTGSNEIKLSFADEGIGIPAEDFSKITEPFFRGSNAKNIPGSGLGLSLTQKIVELHKGSMAISSVMNKGTTVTIILPIIG